MGETDKTEERMRHFATTNGNAGPTVGLVRFDPETVTGERYNRITKEWEEDQADVIDIVTGRDYEAFEVDEDQARKIQASLPDTPV